MNPPNEITLKFSDMETININKADAKLLQKLVHVGKKRAVKIIEARPFNDIYELSKVYGLGKKRLDAMFAQTDVVITL